MRIQKFERGAGILMPITSLPSPYGVGTMGKAAYEFVDLMEKMHQKYWQVLPLGPTSYGDSPYQSFSAFAGNPYMIDLDELIAQKLLKKEEVLQFKWGEREDDINYSILFENRFQVLRMAFERFDQKKVEWKAFCEGEASWLEDYALFMAIKADHEHAGWLTWEEALRDREEKALQENRKRLEKEILFQKFMQYEFASQWQRLKNYANQKGIEIIGDIPLYVALDSADVWAHREQFQLDPTGNPTRVAGCPPDCFSDDGQKWGNPLYNYTQMKQDGFAWWKARMAANARNYDVIRIDHFIGFVRYYSIPAKDSNARKGKWCKGPGKALTDAVLSAIGDSKIIAEDLGVPVPGVRELLQKCGWPRMKILLFAFDGNPDHEYLPCNYDDCNSVVYAGTHDNETLQGYFDERSKKELEYVYKYLQISSNKELVDAIIRLGYFSISNVVIFQMQDILKLGNEARMNLPSTLGINWRWRMKPGALTRERQKFLTELAELSNRNRQVKEVTEEA